MLVYDMSDRTPNKSTNSVNTGFSPVILPQSPVACSPQKNLTGLPRVVRDLVADVYNSIQRWNDFHIKGASIVKEVASLKANNLKDFSTNLEKHMNDLYFIVQELRRYKDALHTLTAQILASKKLQTNSSPLFISLDIGAISKLVEEISISYESEFKVKEYVLENIVYSRNKDEAMFFAALWTYQTKITDQISLKLEILLVETGHRKIT